MIGKQATSIRVINNGSDFFPESLADLSRSHKWVNLRYVTENTQISSVSILEITPIEL